MSKQKKESKIEKKNKLLNSIRRDMEIELRERISINDVIINLCTERQEKLRLSEEHIDKINAISKITHMPKNMVIDSMVQWASKFYNKKYSSSKNIPDKDLEHSHLSGTAYRRVEKFTLAVIKKNDKAKSIMEKAFINSGHIRSNTGANPKAIKSFLEENKKIIAQHHRKHKLTPLHNVRVAREKKRRELEKYSQEKSLL